MPNQSGNRSITLVTTDLFVSAAAALLIIISMSKPMTPKPIPVQADIQAFCTAVEQVQGDIRTSLTLLNKAHIETGQPVTATVTSSADLLSLDNVLGLPSKLFYTVAVTGNNDGRGTVSAACYKHARENVFGQRRKGSPSESDTNRLLHAQFGLVIVPAGSRDESD